MAWFLGVEAFRTWNNGYFSHLSPSLLRTTLRSSASILVIALALSGIVLQFMFPPALAVSSYRAGLKTGDRAYYELNGTYGFSPSQPETHMSVLGVTGTNITAGFSNFWPDGLVTSNVYWLDVFTGQVRNASSNLFFAVTPGLQLYDPIFNGATITITSQQAILCGGASRQVVIAQFTKTNQNVAIAWDQSTGAMCRLNANDQFRFLSMAMKNTTIWGSASTPADAFVIAANVSAALGLPLVALIVFVYLRRRRSRPK
jgi:hypothetical protein